MAVERKQRRKQHRAGEDKSSMGPILSHNPPENASPTNDKAGERADADPGGCNGE